jgi:cytochrome c oxidase cbb3-type subunit 3
MKKIISSLTLLLLSIGAFAQDGAAKPSPGSDSVDPITMVYVVAAFLLIVLVLVGFVAIYLVRILNMMTEQAEKDRAAKKGVAYVPSSTMWSRFTESLNASVPLEQEKNIELGHSYDGIKELDNHLPPWWTGLFYATIIWSVVYLFVYHISDSLPLQGEEYETEVAVAEQQARRLQALQPVQEIDESKLVFTLDSANLISNGKKVFMDNNCGSCHRNDGGGNTIGPNLTDEYWLHGGHIKDVFATVRNGVVDKGMPAWGKSLKPQQVRDVTFFILSLQGTKPENAKQPQGELYKAVQAAADTTKTRASL